jgi:hypothetical protein
VSGLVKIFPFLISFPNILPLKKKWSWGIVGAGILLNLREKYDRG